MAVICEAISVLIAVETLIRTFPDGPAGYEQACPNESFCSDGVLTRVGFMHHNDSKEWVQRLEDLGFTYVYQAQSGAYQAIDLIVVDQLQGPLAECDWLDTDIVDGDRWAWLHEYGRGIESAPSGWLRGRSQDMTFHAKEDEMTMPISHGDVFDESIDPVTGETIYVGRSFENVQNRDQSIRSARLSFQLMNFQEARDHILRAESFGELEPLDKLLAARIVYWFCFQDPRKYQVLAKDGVTRWMEIMTLGDVKSSSENWFNRARLEGLAGDWDASAQSLDIALQINPLDSYSLAERSFVSMARREGDTVGKAFMRRAIDHADTASKLDYVKQVMATMKQGRIKPD